jgi:NADH-quinone oxidoreductase subunit H
MDFWSNPVQFLGDWLNGLLTGWGMVGWLSGLLTAFIGVAVLVVIMMVFDVFLVWVERKVVARFQDRLGPNRLGPFGLIQPFADIVKLLIKEDITPNGADRVVYNLAPAISMMSVIMLWAILPLAPVILGVDLNVALLYLVAAGAFGTLAVIMAGWSSNNKYALVGAFRQVAAMISYEIPMVVMLLIPTILAGTMGTNGIVLAQKNIWFVFLSPLGAVIFLISAIAELGRSPFDLNEAESEIVAGFHIEYTGMKFGMFYAGELLHAFTFGAFMGVLFFGGWSWFGLEKISWLSWLGSPLMSVIAVVFKGMIGYWIIMWVKYTVPRIRIDHMLTFNWKFLTPLSFALLIVTAIVHSVLKDANPWVYGSAMFLSNLLLGWATLEILRAGARRDRAQSVAPAARH